MTDQLSILTHPTNAMAKTWRVDGTIAPYDEAKYFRLRTVQVDGIRQLHKLLLQLEDRRSSCLIRGRHLGEEIAQLDPEHKPGRCRRTLAEFEDQPLHTLLLEVDEFEPIVCDPVTDPEGSIEEYLQELPEEFQGVSYHWQLSNSSGHPTNAGKLKVHLWFWLASPYTSEVVKAWAKAQAVPVDCSVLNPVQVHYTSAPAFEPGVEDPVPLRSGFVEGIISDEVALVIDETQIAVAAAKAPRQGVLRNAIDDDPIAQILRERGDVLKQDPSGKMLITCPMVDRHTSPSGPSSTAYYPPNTGGFAQGAFVCLHDHCRDAAQGEFHAALGYDPIGEDFDDLTEAGEVVPVVGGGKAIEVRPKPIPDAQHLNTDLANARRIMTAFRNRLLVAGDRWYAWVGTHWSQDDGMVYARAVRLSQLIHKEADEVTAKAKREATKAGVDYEQCVRALDDKRMNPPDDDVDALLKLARSLRVWAQKSEMRSAVDNALAIAQKHLRVPPDQLDADRYLLNTVTGTIDLRTGEQRKHSARDYITHCVPVAYRPGAPAPHWRTALRQIMRETGADETPLVDFLQRWFGYCATGDVTEQKLAVHYGHGSNGKSTIIEQVEGVLNGYAGTAPAKLLTSDGRSGDEHPTMLASLRGARMVTAHEADEGAQLREGQIKQATGGDTITARWMRGDYFDFSPTHKLQLLTNHKPAIKGTDAGIWRRVMLIPYTAYFGTAEEVQAGLATDLKDTRLPARLAEEQEGILAWIVEGAVAWFKGGLRPPAAVVAASEEYRTEQDRVKVFVMEVCECGQAERDFFVYLDSPSGGLYPEYRRWCDAGGIRPLGKRKFMEELRRVHPAMGEEDDAIRDDFDARKKVKRLLGIRLARFDE